MSPRQNRKLNREVAAEQNYHTAMWKACLGKRKTDVELLASEWKATLERMAKPGEEPKPIENFEMHKQALERLRGRTSGFICRAMQSWDVERIIALARAMLELDHAKQFVADWPTIYLLQAKNKGQAVNLSELKSEAEQNGTPCFSLKTWARRAKQLGVKRIRPGRPKLGQIAKT